MDCRICMEDKIEQKNFLHLNCGHVLCVSCFDKLIKNTCPYCREIIEDKVEGSYGNIDIEINVTDYIYDIDNSTEIDNILPMSELYYIEDLYYNDDSYDIIHNNRRKKKRNHNKKHFTANCDREPHQRRKKKWKKKKRN